MTYLTGEVSVIHDWTKIDFTNFVYSAFRFNGVNSGPTTTINGATINKIVGITIDSVINENTTTIDEDLILLGNPKSVFPSTFDGVINEYISKYSFYFEGDDKRQFFNFGKPSSVNDLTGSVTVSTFMNVDGDHAVDGYSLENYAGGSGLGIGYDNSPDQWRFRVGLSVAGLEDIQTATLSPKTNGAGEWVNITGTWNNDTKDLKIYVNGKLENTNNYPGNTLVATTQDLRIGGGSTSTGEMKGAINNIVVWDVALDDSEVLSHYNNGNPYNVLINGPFSDNIVFWSKVGDDSNWNGSDQWTIKDEVNNINGLSSTSGAGSFAPMTYSSRIKNTP
jgi:hypothetical protein